ncbi:MAG: macro domain-containing protein [Cyanobacteria bacterium J06623_1]
MTAFGLIWLFTEPAALFFQLKFSFGWSGYFYLFTLAVIIGIIQTLPHLSMSRSLSSPDVEIEIKIGDIFNQAGHLVIGFNDVFDTEIGKIIKSSSVQGQFLQKIYKGKRLNLDADIDNELNSYELLSVEDHRKTIGKRRRYPIGTTITLGSYNRYYFLVAYGYMNPNLTVQSKVDDIWKSLSKLWEMVRLKGHASNISIPIIGTDLARTGIPRMVLVKLLIMSFVVASKEKFVTRKLTVMVFPDDVKSIDWCALEDFLDSACF